MFDKLHLEFMFGRIYVSLEITLFVILKLQTSKWLL